MRRPGSPSLAEFIDSLQARGRYWFARQEAHEAVGGTDVGLKNALARQTGKSRIVAPRRGFWVIVPLEYRSAGSPPPSWFINDLMSFHQHPYYVGLLSAAAIHGAAHQRPQVFQVVTDTQLRPAKAGRARLDFIFKKELNAIPVENVKTETGKMVVSSPEATAADLVRYFKAAAGLSNVATVLSELSEKIDARRLVDLARAGWETATVQRLGYLLDLVGAADTAASLADWIADRKPVPVPLRPTRKTKGLKRNNRWRVLVNETIEVDE